MSIYRKKGSNGSENWDLLDNGVKIGEAVAEHKTRTQRTWNAKVEINGQVYSATGEQSVRTAIATIESKITNGEHDVHEAVIVATEAVEEPTPA